MSAVEPSTDQDWEATLIAHSGMLYRITYSVLHHHADAEDAVQEALHRAWRYRRRSGRIANPGAWLARIAWRTALAQRPRPAAISLEELTTLEALRASGASAEELASREEMHQLLETILSRLPRKLREPLLLSTVQGLGHAEVAYVLGISEAAVRGQCLRARRLLQQKCNAALRPQRGKHASV